MQTKSRPPSVMQRLVINELVAWNRLFKQNGLTTRIIGKTVKTFSEDEWQWAAKAYNPRTGIYNYLLVKKDK